MLPRERVFAALNHQEPDRIPWGEHSIDYNVYEDILGRPTFVQAKMRETQALWDGRRDEVVESYKRDRLDLVRALDMDIVAVGAVPPKGCRPEPLEKLDAETYGDKEGNLYQVSPTTHDLMPYKRSDKSMASYVSPTVEGIQAEIDKFDPDAAGDPDDSQWELVRHAVRETKATHFIMLLCGDLSFPTFGANEEEHWMNLALYPEICAKLAELAGLRLVREMKLFARLGVDGIMPCGDLGSSTSLMASPQIYREMVYPVHKAHAAAAHKAGLKVLKHCCGHVWPVIDELAEVYDAYEGIQASAGMDIRALKERVGGKLCLWGGIWHEHIILGGPADMRRDAAYAFRWAAPGGGYIMGSTHSLAVGAKAENILEMKRARDEWGIYPIDPRRFAKAEGKTKRGKTGEGSEKAVHGRAWGELHGRYFSDPAIARPLVNTVSGILDESRTDAVADLGGGTGFLLSQLRQQGVGRRTTLVNLDCSDAQLAVSREAGIRCVRTAVETFSRDDVTPGDGRVLFMMRSVLHYFGEAGLSPLLDHIRAQARKDEYFVHQTACFDDAREAACLNALYRHMRTGKWYPTTGDLQGRLAQAGWKVTHTLNAPPLPLGSDDLARRYALDADDIARIRDAMSREFGAAGEVFRLEPSGFCAILRYRIFTCVAAPRG